MQTKAEKKAAQRAANQALTADLRRLVADGREAEAMAMVADRPASWAQIVTDAVRARDAKAARKAEAAKAAKAPEAPEAPEAPTAPVVDTVADPSADMVAAVTAAVLAVLGQAAPTAPVAAPVVAPVAAPVGVGVDGEVFSVDHDTALKGLAFLTYGKVGRVLKANDATLTAAAKREARECAAWCERAASQADDKATAVRLGKKAAVYREALVRLSA